MQLILFVEICSKMSSRVIFWSNKSICTLIWIPSKYTQMSVYPNHYLEPCLIQLYCYTVVQFYNCIAVQGKFDEDDVHYLIYKQTWLKFDVEFMVPQFMLCFQAYLSDVQLIIQCNYIVIVLYLYSLKLFSLYSYAVYAVIVLSK